MSRCGVRFAKAVSRPSPTPWSAFSFASRSRLIGGRWKTRRHVAETASRRELHAMRLITAGQSPRPLYTHRIERLPREIECEDGGSDPLTGTTFTLRFPVPVLCKVCTGNV